MKTRELHIAEIGEYFINLDGFEFMSDQNLLEYDFIVMDTKSLFASIKNSSVKSIEKRIDDLKEFIKTKNIPIVFFVSTEDLSFSTIAHYHEDGIINLLDLEVEVQRSSGKKLEVQSGTALTDLLLENISSFEYTASFVKHPGVNIANAKNKKVSIGFYTPDFVFLPGFSEENNQIDEDDFLHKLYEICRSIRKEESVISIPSWTNEYYLPGEQLDQAKLENIVTSIEKLEKERLQQEQILSNYRALKQLWTTTGSTLEKAVTNVFKELGFAILDTIPGRDDIIMKWKKQIVVVEVKGVTKSAAEKNAAQLEKWTSTYMSEHGVKAKGILLVNTFRELNLDKRTQESFPVQMRPYSKDRKHCLITSLQLCCLLLYVRNHPTEKDKFISALLKTIGVYSDFLDWRKYISAQSNK